MGEFEECWWCWTWIHTPSWKSRLFKHEFPLILVTMHWFNLINWFQLRFHWVGLRWMDRCLFRDSYKKLSVFTARWDLGNFHTFLPGQGSDGKSCLGVLQGPANQWQVLRDHIFWCGLFFREFSHILPLWVQSRVHNTDVFVSNSFMLWVYMAGGGCVFIPGESQKTIHVCVSVDSAPESPMVQTFCHWPELSQGALGTEDWRLDQGWSWDWILEPKSVMWWCSDNCPFALSISPLDIAKRVYSPPFERKDIDEQRVHLKMVWQCKSCPTRQSWVVLEQLPLSRNNYK